jgi:quinol-cytochrome oxidoreductase complex cytochrome b subunit
MERLRPGVFTNNIGSVSRIDAPLFSPILSVLRAHLIYYPTPQQFYYVFGVGSLLGVMFVVQVLTGVLLAMHYVPSIDLAFDSVERIMREIPSGWLLRYLHANGSSMIFILLYAHIARGLFYQSYRTPRQWVWASGVIIFVLSAGIAFLGYTLPWGQMSFWGATVITNIITAIPLVGDYVVTWVWGGFSVNTNTLNRFFSLHYILSIVVLGLAGVHLALLHEVGSTSVIGRESSLDLVKFYPYFFLKDLFTFLAFLVIYLYFTIYTPNLFGHSDNYIEASPIVTPAHIVPEWYFLPFYAMLKSLPSKLGGAICMVAAMVIWIILPWWTDSYNLPADPAFRPFSTTLFNALVAVFAALGLLGAKVLVGALLILTQFLTVVYFAYFLLARWHSSSNLYLAHESIDTPPVPALSVSPLPLWK